MDIGDSLLFEQAYPFWVKIFCFKKLIETPPKGLQIMRPRQDNSAGSLRYDAQDRSGMTSRRGSDRSGMTVVSSVITQV
ncbi:hypothetical protein [Deinococcus rubellus]|uniref:hypothetical protein n=1 Tax=Deinococcus rubellus TaxID=1889240 RepID=UPI0031F0B7B5